MCVAHADRAKTKFDAIPVKSLWRPCAASLISLAVLKVSLLKGSAHFLKLSEGLRVVRSYSMVIATPTHAVQPCRFFAKVHFGVFPKFASFQTAHADDLCSARISATSKIMEACVIAVTSKSTLHRHAFISHIESSSRHHLLFTLQLYASFPKANLQT